MKPSMALIPKGAYPLGRCRSRKLPGRCTRWNLELNTSTRPLWKSVAYRNVPNRVLASVSPLKTAPLRELNFTWAVDMPFTTGSATGLQAMICPPSEEKMNSAGALPAMDLILNPLVGLNTCPVGLESMGGRVTTRGTCVAMAPPGLTPYSVATLVPLSATHSGVVGPKASPQGFFRLGSTICAPTVVRSEIRLVCRNSLSGPWPWVRAEAAGAAVPTASAAGIAMASTPAADVRSRRNLDDMDTSFRSREGIADTLDTDERDERLSKPAECDIFAIRRAPAHARRARPASRWRRRCSRPRPAPGAAGSAGPATTPGPARAACRSGRSRG